MTEEESMTAENGKQNGRTSLDERVRVALVGVGNCANSLLQGVEYYKDAPDEQFVPGLMHVNLGGYHIRDIEFTAAFDVTTDKVGKDLAEAIWAHPNDTIKFAEVPTTGIEVARGMTHDGLGKYISQVVSKAPGETDDVVGILRDTKTDVVEKNVHVGPSDYVPWLTDRKWAYIRMEGSSFGDVPLNLELKLEVWDSPNSAGIVIDAVRLAKLALNNGVAGALEGPSSYLMKSPPKQIVDDEAYEQSEQFIEKYRRKTIKTPAKAKS